MFWHLVARLEWRNDDGVGRRHELYARAAPIFRKHGYAGTTLKALARACELSIPALYRYFPSKKAFALFPLMALYPSSMRARHAYRPQILRRCFSSGSTMRPRTCPTTCLRFASRKRQAFAQTSG